MKYKVDFFEFANEKEAELAKNEMQKVSYIKNQTKMDDPDVVLALYNKLLDKNLFQTVVGMRFLCELQEYLHTIPYIKNESIMPIPVMEKIHKKPEKPVKSAKADKAKKTPKAKKTEKNEKKEYKTAYRIALFFAVVFGVAVIGMFSILALSKDNLTIINYENQLINKYEQWENDLRERENAIYQKEQQLKQK